MKRFEYDMLRRALVAMGNYNCDGVECHDCPLALDGRCMVAAMIKQMIAYKNAGNVKD